MCRTPHAPTPRARDLSRPRQGVTATPQITIALEPEMVSNNPARRADTKALHYPTRIRRRASVLTFCLTTR
jgi:hypothetical protein